MEDLNNEISRNNKIPGSVGCDSYTRPEEISVLSKYLGKKRKALEESINLDSTILGVPGKTTGKFPNIEELPEKVEELDLSREEELKKLSDRLISLDNSSSPSLNITLPKDIIKLGEIKDIEELAEKVIGLQDNISEVELPDTIKILEVDQNTELEDKRVDLSVESDLELSNTRKDLDVNSDLELSNVRKDIEIESDLELSNTRKDIEVESDLELSNTRKDLDVNSDIELSNTRKDLEVESDIELSNTRKDLEVESDIELSNTRKDIEIESDLELSNVRKDLEVESDLELSNTRKDLYVESDIELSNTRKDLEVESDIELSNTRKDLDVDSDIELSNTRKDLEVESDIELSNTRKDLDVDSDIELSNVRKDIKAESDLELSNTRKDLDVDSDIELSNVRKDIEIESDLELSNTRKDIDVNSNIELSNIRKDIEVELDLELEDKIINLEDPTENELSSTIKALPGEITDLELSDLIKTLDDISVVELSEEIIQLGGEIKEISLEKTRKDLEIKSDLELENTKKNLEVESKIEELEDTRIDIEVENELELGDFIDQLETEDKVTSISTKKVLLGSAQSPENQENYAYLKDGITLRKEVNKEEKLPISQSPETQKSDYTYFDPKVEGNRLYEDSEKIPVDQFKQIITSNAAPGLKPGQSYEMIDYVSDLGYKVEKIYNEDYLGNVKNRKPQISLESPQAPNTQVDWLGSREIYTEEEIKTRLGQLTDYTVEGDGEEFEYDNPALDPGVDGKWNLGEGKSTEAWDWDHDREHNPLPKIADHIGNDIVNTEEEKTKKAYEVLNTINTKPQISLESPQAPNTQTDWLGSKEIYTEEEIRTRSSKLVDYTKTNEGGEVTEEKYNNPDKLNPGVDNVWSLGEGKSTEAWDLDHSRALPSVPDHIGNDIVDTLEEKTKKAYEVLDTVEDKPQVFVPSYKLPDTLSTDPNSYIRWMAEEAIRPLELTGDARKIVLDEVLSTIILTRDEAEKLINAEKYRLPGNTGLLTDIVSGGLSLKEIARTVGDSIANAISTDITNPINRPKIDKETGETKTTGWENANNIPTATPNIKTNGKLFGNLKDFLLGGSGSQAYQFKDNYLQGDGIKTTLLDLVGSGVADLQNGTVEEFFELLKSSPYLTTGAKVTSTDSGYRVMTLDTNSNWEIIFEPYAGVLNGGYTFLPLIGEINRRNLYLHGIETDYSRWIPISSFELQKEKLTTKSLGLYDGEITYPTSVEFTNEFRMTIVDDQYKSWRTYFETCMNAAVYSSTPNILEVESDNVATSKSQHKKKVLKSRTTEVKEDGEIVVVAEEYFDVYEAKDNGYSNIITKTTPEGWKRRDLVKIDKNYQLVAPYKNLSFRCRILVMTPQLSTVTKYDLLLVLKDFSEERSGEIDSSGTDLTLSFSIVGENPPDEVNTTGIRSEVDNAKKEAKKKKEEQKKLDKNLNNLGSSLIKHGTSTVVGLI